MVKRQKSLEHGIRKPNCVKKKKKIHNILRKITDEQKSGSVKTNLSKFIDTSMDIASYNTSEKNTDLLSQNFKLVNAKFVKGKSRDAIKHKNEAAPTEDANCVNGKRKTSKKKTVSEINCRSLNEGGEIVDHDVLLRRKATLKQQKRNGKVLKKSVKNVVQGTAFNGENFQGNCVYQLQKDGQSNDKKKCKSFFRESNLKNIGSPDIPSCNKTLPPSEENIIGDEASTTDGLGKRNKRGKLVQKKKSRSICEQVSPHTAVEHKLLNKNKIGKVCEKDEVNSYTNSFLETSVNSLEEEIENSWGNPPQMHSEINENSFGSMSSPICVEMHQKIDESSDMFKKSIQSYQMHAAKRVVSEKRYLKGKERNIPASNKWKISMGRNPLKNQSNKTTFEDSNEKEREKCDLRSSNNTAFKLIKLARDCTLMVLYPQQTVFFHGIYSMRVLFGTVDVLGYKIQDNGDYTIYSPWNFHMFGIHACAQFQHDEEDYYNILESTILSEINHPKINASILRSFPMSSCFILLKQISDTRSLFLNKYFNECFTPFHVENICSLSNPRFFSRQKLNKTGIFEESEEWNDLSKYFMEQSGNRKIMVCGGKGVGKSSFLRFLCNRMISSAKRILYIDLDLGQCEFTPPGCVSAVVVKQPLLGPSFTHLTNPVRCIYIGRVDVSKCHMEYLQSVELLLEWCTSKKYLRKMPWVINTMGFCQGLGVDLTIACIKLVCPTDVVQIESSMKSKNFPFQLECTSVGKKSMDSLFPYKDIKVNYEFHSFLHVPFFLPSNFPEPSMLREIAVMAYFSECIEASDLSWAKSSEHELDFKTLKLCICHEKVNYSYYLSAMNANVVGLCNVGNSHGLVPTDTSYPEIWTSTPISNYYGMGIVRGVDMEEKKVYIISPLPKSTIYKVNCLVLGAVYLPENVYTLQKSGQGNIPYITEGHGLAETGSKRD